MARASCARSPARSACASRATSASGMWARAAIALRIPDHRDTCRSPRDRCRARNDARRILLEQITIALQLGGRRLDALNIIGAVLVALLERGTRVLLGLALGLGLGEWHQRAFEIAQLAGRARFRRTHVPACRGAGRYRDLRQPQAGDLEIGRAHV